MLTRARTCRFPCRRAFRGPSLDAMKADTFLTGILGEPFVAAYETLKRDEIRRYEEAVADPQTRDVTQWELDEYIEDF